MAATSTTNVLKLSPLDHIMPASYTRLLLCFPFKESSSVNALTDSIQVGIDNIVCQMPFLAGHVHPQDDASETKRAHVLYPLGSPTVTLNVLELPSFPQSYSALSAAGVPLEHLDNRFAPVSVFADPLSAACPVFAIQATFIPGGVFLCVCVHHYIMDGTGFGAFLGQLAESCRTAGQSSIPHVRDIQDRNPCLVGLSDDGIPKTHPEYKLVDLNAPPKAQSAPPALPPMQTRLFRFSASSLSKLKADITTHFAPDESLPSFVSTNDCLTALLWSCVTRTRLPHLTPPNEKSSRLGMAVNGRRHLSPPLPPDYLGNVNLFATSILPVASLSSPDLESLATTARHVRQAIIAIDNQHIRSAISLISAQKNIKSIGYGFNSFLGPDLAVTSWESIRAYSHDWGCGIGRAQWVRTIPSGAGFDGLGMVMPRRIVLGEGEGNEKRELEVMLGLRKEDMDRLEGDEVWRAYCNGRIVE